MNLFIIIPAYNEEKRIGNTLEEFGKFFSEKRKVGEIEDFKILVVLNGCKDKTIEIVKKSEKKFKGIFHLNFSESGKGFAIIEGFKEALKGGADLIGFVDADNATSAGAFFELAKNMQNHDGIIASRYVPGAVVNPKQSFQRIIASRAFNVLVRSLLFLPYRDTQCGAKLFKKEAIKEVVSKLGITKWAFDIDLLYRLRKKGFSIIEHPTVWQDKEYSKINLKSAGPSMALAVARLRLINSPLKEIVKAYDLLFK